MKKKIKTPVDLIDKALQRFDPIWKAENGKGGERDRFYDKTGIAKYREWRGVHDTLRDYRAWLKNLDAMGMMVLKDPVHVLKGIWEYRWMGSFLGSFAFVDRLFEGYRGPELEIACIHGNAIVHALTDKIGFILKNDKRLGGGPESDHIVGLDETIPSLFMAGFPTLYGEPMQTLPEFVICDVDQFIEPYYIDVAESYGLSADVCSRCSAETGVAIDDAFPIFGKLELSTNQPCNASESTSMFQRRRFARSNIESYPFVFAMQHNTENGHEYSTDELKQAIAKIEEVYGVQYDWDAFFEKAKLMNEQNRIEMEKWDIFATPYSPLSGISESLYKLVEWALVNGHDKYFNKVDRKVIKIMNDCVEKKYEPFQGKTRHRAFLWGPSAVYYTDFPTWTQNCWGIDIVLNMDSTMGHNMINTEDPDIAIKDLAKFSEKGVMRHHAVGGWDNVDAVWDWARKLNCDMVIMNDNIACKGMNGVHAMMEERAREQGFHFVFLPHDLEDSRTISRQDMRDAINDYMTVVMNEKPLDLTLVQFDDSEAW